jgi:hypothetical protein
LLVGGCLKTMVMGWLSIKNVEHFDWKDNFALKKGMFVISG